LSEINNSLLMKAQGLCKSFSSGSYLNPFKKSIIRAVQDVSLEIKSGEMIGLIGRSGSGKSTLIRCLAKLLNPDRGKIYFLGEEITSLSPKQFKNMRKHLQVIFQNNYSALNPGMKVKEMLRETARLSGYTESLERIIQRQMQKINLSTSLLDRYPGELSGGECRRIGIAMIDLIGPELLLADEPVTALDYINKWEILSMFKNLNEEKNATLLIATHDLEAVLEIVDRVIVMYGGTIVEQLPIADLWQAQHPHTVELIRYHGYLKNKLTAEVLNSYTSKAEGISRADIKTGCVFADNCQRYFRLGKPEQCLEKQPPLIAVNSEHQTACYFYNKAVE
jgi:peptide/nickel transport system ATP-binding protein